MKPIVVFSLMLVSSAAMADGFRCQGQNYRVKLFNETQPTRGTRNPATLVVSQKDVGTVVRLRGDEIEKSLGDRSVSFSGRTNSEIDGRYVAIRLEIARKATVTRLEGALPNAHFAMLTLTADGATTKEALACDRYLKRGGSR